MTGSALLIRFLSLSNWLRSNKPTKPPDLHTLWLCSDRLPRFVSETPVARRLLDWLGPLAWASFPERNLIRNWGQRAVPYAACAAACLLKLNEGLRSMGDLRQYLVEHPALVWLCGFPLVTCREAPHGFDAEASLPTQRHLTRLLRRRRTPPCNSCWQTLSA